ETDRLEHPEISGRSTEFVSVYCQKNYQHVDTSNPVTSLQPEELLEFGFRQNRHSQFFRLLVFGAGVGADYDVVGFLADGAGNFAAVLEDEFAGFFAAAIG